MAKPLRPVLLVLPWLLLAAVVGLYVDETLRFVRPGPVSSVELAATLALQTLALLLVVGPLGVVVAAVEQRLALGALTPEVRRLVTWTPRVAVLLFAAFVGVFALDVFAEGQGFWTTALALVVHLIPTFALLLFAALAWRWPWVGAVAMVGWAAFYMAEACCRFNWTVYPALAGGPLALGLLFALDAQTERPGQAAGAA